MFAQFECSYRHTIEDYDYEETEIRWYIAKRTGVLKNINTTIGKLNESVAAGDREKVQFHLLQLIEKWALVKNITAQLQDIFPGNERLTNDEEFVMNEKDKVDEAIYLAEIHMKIDVASNVGYNFQLA